MARRFNGTSDYIRYGHLSELDGAAAAGVSFWWNTDAVQLDDYPSVWGVTETDGTNDNNFLFGTINLDGFKWLMNSRDNTGNHDAGAPYSGAWHHVFIQFDGSQGTPADRFKQWIDGTETAFNNGGDQNFQPTLGTTAPDGPWTFGADFRAEPVAISFWKGDLAEFAIWLNTDTTKITALAAGYAPSFYQTNLLAYWPLHINDGARDLQERVSPTINGTTEVEHPPNIIYPGRFSLSR